jgi:hypothetical protein
VINVSRNHFSPWRPALSNPALLILIGEMRRTLRGCHTVLDVGCGDNSPLRFLTGPVLVGVDGYQPALEEARRRGTHDEYSMGDVKKICDLFPLKKFDACVALDVIEHLPKEEGWQMLENMERLASRRVVISTPNGFLPQRGHGSDLQEHLSGWTPGEMRQRGYQVYGLYGPKSLRGEYHRIKYQPRVFWALVSMLAHYSHTRNRPEKSAAIFCVKDLEQ